MQQQIKEKEDENVLFAAGGFRPVAFVLGFAVSPGKTAACASMQLAPCRMGHGILNMRQVSVAAAPAQARGSAAWDPGDLLLGRAGGVRDAPPRRCFAGAKT